MPSVELCVRTYLRVVVCVKERQREKGSLNEDVEFLASMGG